ncbi:MAG: phospholipase [Paludibacteraceae bacterium]
MIALILILIFVGIVVFTATYFNRKDKNEPIEIVVSENVECCGAHEVCDRENLQVVDMKIEYFDDEELDTFAGVSPEKYTKQQINTISDVFYSMKENDVAPWLRSLQLRDIQLPDFLKEEAFLIVGERRG